MFRRPPGSTRTDTLCPYTPLFRSQVETVAAKQLPDVGDDAPGAPGRAVEFETGGARIHAQQACLLSRRRHRADDVPRLRPRDMAEQPGSRRSEEHTSELQSLMRISYAAFCLKKKNTRTTTNT